MMTVRQRFGPLLFLILVIVGSMLGCSERGPRGEQGGSGSPGQPGEVITVTTPGPDVAPLPSDSGLSTRQAQPRVHFDPAALPAGVSQVEVVPGSPARFIVTFTLTDDTGAPIDRALLEPLRFTLSHIEVGPQTGLTAWHSDIVRTQTSPVTHLSVTQPADETNGTYAALGNGVYRYTFATGLPAGFDPSRTYRIGVQARRRVGDRAFVDNATFDFLPNGGVRLVTRDVVQTANCQRCHEPLALHGGIRTEVKVCVQCHTAQNTDPDTLDPIPGNAANPHFDPSQPGQALPNPLDFASLIHRIHRGRALKEEDGITYQVIGFQQSVADYSEVEFPQEIRNCTTCHTGTSEADNYKIAPSRTACGSCHVRTWFGDPTAVPAMLQAHAGGQQTDDTKCTSCHTAEGAEFDLSVRGAHTNPQRSVQAAGVNFTIVRVEDADDGDRQVNPGHHARVVLHLQDNAGNAILPSTMALLRVTLAGPTTDYRIQDYNGDGEKTPGEPLRGAPFTKPGEDYVQVDARRASGPDADGNFSVTLRGPLVAPPSLTIADAAIPRDAVGTYAVGIEGYRCARIVGLDRARGGANCTTGNSAFDEIRDVGQSVVAYFAVTDGQPVPRRQVVDTASRCVACHGVFSKDFPVHGGIRNNSEYCVLCHNASHGSLGRQPAPAAGQTADTFPVDFKLMVHKIHRGENLTRDYLLFAPAGTATNARDLLFPGDLRHCQKCHVTDAQGDRTELLIPGQGILGSDVQPTVNHQMDSSKRVLETFETGPIKSVCTACHDTDAALGHADLMTTPVGVETCDVCHGVGKDFAVEKVHAQ